MKKVSWAKKEIAKVQLAVQRQALELALLQVELNLRPESNRETWSLRDELAKQLRLLKEAQKEVEDMPAKKKRFWSGWVVGIYRWATQDRFKFY